MSKGGSVILRIYFVLVSFVTLMILIFTVGDLLNIGLKTWVFTAADAPTYVTQCPPAPAIDANGKAITPTSDQLQACATQQASDIHADLVQKEQNAVRDLSLLIVALPLFLIHFRLVYKDWEEMRKEKE